MRWEEFLLDYEIIAHRCSSEVQSVDRHREMAGRIPRYSLSISLICSGNRHGYSPIGQPALRGF